MRDALANRLREYVELVRKLADEPEVSQNHEATRASLVGPLFTKLGWDLTQPNQCISEWRPPFGMGRSIRSIDWAFFKSKNPIFIVEVKRRKDQLHRHSEQLSDYFHKAKVKLGILTNGVEWRFFSDLQCTDRMDAEPFMIWGVLDDRQPPPIELLKLLKENTYDAEKVLQFARLFKKLGPFLREARVAGPPSVECKRIAAIVNAPDDPVFPGQGVPISVAARMFRVSRVTIQDRCMILLLIPEVLDEMDAYARGEDGLSLRQVVGERVFFHAGTGTDDVRIPKTRDEQLALIAKLKGTRGLGALREADLAARRKGVETAGSGEAAPAGVEEELLALIEEVDAVSGPKVKKKGMDKKARAAATASARMVPKVATVPKVKVPKVKKEKGV